MKYIVLSFDDGYHDFLDFAYPILQKFNIKCSINLTGGLISKTIESIFQPLSVEEIQNLIKEGFEISNHSFSHKKRTDYNDILSNDIFLKKNFGIKKVGYITPYSIPPDNLTIQKLSKNTLYCADVPLERHLFKFRIFIIKIINHIFHFKNMNYYINDLKCIYSKKLINSNYPLFKRIVLHDSNNIDFAKKITKTMKNNTAITFVFHSIINNKCNCQWPSGSFTQIEFEDFIKFLKCQKNVQILTQNDLFKLWFGK